MTHIAHTHTSCSEACSGCVRCLPADLARHLREPFRSQVCRIEGLDRAPVVRVSMTADVSQAVEAIEAVRMADGVFV